MTTGELVQYAGYTLSMGNIPVPWSRTCLHCLLLLFLAGCDAQPPVDEPASTATSPGAGNTLVDVSSEPLSKDIFGKVATLPENTASALGLDLRYGRQFHAGRSRLPV